MGLFLSYACNTIHVPWSCVFCPSMDKAVELTITMKHYFKNDAGTVHNFRYDDITQLLSILLEEVNSLVNLHYPMVQTEHMGAQFWYTQ